MKSALDTSLDGVIAAITAPGGPLGVGTATVRGTDLPVFGAAPASLREFFAHFFMVNGPKEFLVFGDERLTFAEVHSRGREFAAMLQHRHGIAKGDRVAIAMRNYPDWIIAFIGVIELGAIAIPMNAWWTAEEIDYGLKDSGARLAIADEERARRMASLSCSVTVLTVRTAAEVAAGLGFVRVEDELALAPKTLWFSPEINPEDDATIMYTSGSTGSPKGAVSTHRAIVSGAMNYLVAGLALLALSQAAGAAQPEQQVMLLNVPLFHITGSVPVMLVSIAIGRKMVIMHKWDAGEALRLIEKERCTYFVGVPTMSLELMQHPDHAKYDLSSLVDIASGGAPRPPEHVERLAKTFAGKNPVQGYGLTETNGVGAGNFRDNYRAKPASTGRQSAPLVELRIDNGDGVVGAGLPAGTVRHATVAVTGTSPRQPPQPFPATAGSGRVISAISTRMVTCSSSTGRRTSSSAAAKTSAARRSNRHFTSIPPSPKPASSGCLTNGWAKSSVPWFLPTPAMRWNPMRWSISSAATWRRSRCRRGCGSAPSHFPSWDRERSTR